MSNGEPNKRVESAIEALTVLGPRGDQNEEFCKRMSIEHRTHQQNFTRLCVAWLEHCGDPNYGADLRNQASADLGKVFVEKLSDDAYLPFV